jgi:acyl-CoA dehydrogenase
MEPYMSEYRAPIDDMRFALALAGLDDLLALESFSDYDKDTVHQVLDEAAKFAADVLAPLNVPGDQAGCRVEDRAVVVADGFAEAFRQYVENGWQSLPVSAGHGGMGMPEAINAATVEMWQAANMSLALCPLLTAGAIVALESHGNDLLKSRFLPKLAAGEWSGTMNLTEPHAGSDLAALTTRAVPDGDAYLISGTKIFITWGDHPMTENIVHLVLARLPDAPSGVRGISMFAVPKFLVNEDGDIGERNDVWRPACLR